MKVVIFGLMVAGLHAHAAPPVKFEEFSNPVKVTTPSGQTINTAVLVPGNGAGVNTMFVSPYLNHLHGQCDHCPAWIGKMSLGQIKESLSLIQGSSLTQFREIIEAGRFFPKENKLEHFEELATLLLLYQEMNASVMLGFGTPIAPWMNPEFSSKQISYSEDRICILPTSDEAWLKMKNNLSNAYGTLLKAIWDDSRFDKSWVAKHLTIDPFNEFDSILGGNCSKETRGTGKRAAELTGGIQWVLNSLDIPVVVTMPSGGTGTMEYFQSFYESGGQAMANVHAYYTVPNKNPADPQIIQAYADFLVEYLGKVNKVVPAAYKNKIVLGEYGNFQAPDSVCSNTSLPDCRGRVISGAALENYMTGILGDGRIQSIAPIRMLWMMVDSNQPQPGPGEGAYLTTGFLDTDLIPKPSIFHYLLSEGLDLASDPVRLPTLKEKIRTDLSSPPKAPPTNETIAAFVKDLIYGKDSWAKLVKKYSGSKPEALSYFWKEGDWSECSRACGGGLQTRAISCAESSGKGTKESFCKGTKPASSQSCNSQGCTVDEDPTTGSATFITALYEGLLGREPDPAGFKYWENSYANDKSFGCKKIALSFFVQEEFSPIRSAAKPGTEGAKVYLSRLYKGLFGRDPEAWDSGYNYWLAELNKGMPLESIEKSLVQSPEFETRCGLLGMRN